MSLLPTKKTKPNPLLSNYNILIYGAPKTGKTTFVSNFPNVILAATEEGYGALSVFATPIKTWQNFLDFCTELQTGKHSFENVCIDTVDNLLQLCTVHILGKHHVDHESDLQYGKGYALVLNEFLRAMTKLSQLPYGLIMISHQDSENIKTRTDEYNKAVPSIRGKARKSILGMCDFILFFASTTSAANNEINRVIRTKPSKFYEAGDRTGFLPNEIPLDYKTFINEFTVAIKKLVAGKRPNDKQEKKQTPPVDQGKKKDEPGNTADAEKAKAPPADKAKAPPADKETDVKFDQPGDQGEADKTNKAESKK